MSEQLPLCGTGDTVTLYPTPDNCFEQIGDNVTVHYQGKAVIYDVPGNATATSAWGQDCLDYYASCNETSVSWAFPPSDDVPLAATGLDASSLLIGLVVGIVLVGISIGIISSSRKKD